MDVFFYEAFEEEEKVLSRLLNPSLSFGFARETIQESGHIDPPSTFISIRTQSIVPEKWTDRLGGILSRTTGFDHLKLLRRTWPGRIPLGYLEEYATRAVAEHAMMTVMCLLRRLPSQIRMFDRFTRDGLTGSECKGRTMLIVGVGRIGHEIASIAQGLDIKVKGVDIVQRHPDIVYTTKEEGIAWADIIVCAMNLTPENVGYFSAEVMRSAKPGVLLVNIARGEHTPLEDIRVLLAEGHLGGIGLDVFEDEPAVAGSFRDPSSPQSPKAVLLKDILTYPNVLCTPHNAFNTREAVEGKAAFTVSQIHHFLKEGDFLWKV